MLILGLNVGHDSGAVLYSESGLLAAVNEERLSRIKMHTGFPARAIEEALRIAGKSVGEVKVIAIEGRHFLPQTEFGTDLKSEDWKKRLLVRLHVSRFLLGTETGLTILRLLLAPATLLGKSLLTRKLRAMGFAARVVWKDHHHCHAAAAYFSQPSRQGLAITLDASGEGYCSKVYLCRDDRMEEVHRIPCHHSPAYFYAYITQLLGFLPFRHEGKITGLAAYGDPEKVTKVLRGLIYFDKSSLAFVNRAGYHTETLQLLREILGGFSREDVAAGIQRYTEELTCSYIAECVQRFGPVVRHRDGSVDLFLAGGLFANVKVNQRVQDLPGVGDLYVFPNMGDGGLNVGAAFIEAARRGLFKRDNQDIRNLYWARDFSRTDIEAALKASGLTYYAPENLASEVARLVVAGKVVGRFCGPMEFGPRALGARSIIYSAEDPAVNQWLNQRLKRTEFMPFAPFVQDRDAETYFKLPSRSHRPMWFMTVTCDVTERCRKEAPGIVHVDGTARPQIVIRDVNPSYYDILEEYKKLTGIGVLVNTSFNMHEEPIVNSPKEAIETYLSGKLDVLAIGDFIVTQS